MFNLELTLEELSELHVTMFLRKNNLLEDIKHKDPKIVEISMRQLERISPICYYIESVLREHHMKEAA
jgi:hypothetical protein